MKTEIKYKINWIGFFNIILFSIVMGFVGVGLPETINKINHTINYGYYASYTITCLLFWLVIYNIKLIKEKKN